MAGKTEDRDGDDEKKSSKKSKVNNHIELEPKLDISKDDGINEALSREGRRRRSLAMRRNRNKMKRAREMAKRKTAGPAKIERRARRQAIDKVRTKFTGSNKYDDLSISQKNFVDQKVAKRKKVVDRTARKLIPLVRKAERDRRSGKTTSESVVIEKKVYKPSPSPKKRFHQLLGKDGKVKHDRRFRFNKKQVTEDKEPLKELSSKFVKSIKIRVPGIPDEIMKQINSKLDAPYAKRAVANLWKLNKVKGDKHTFGHYAREVALTFDEYSPRELVRIYSSVFEEAEEARNIINEEFEELMEKSSVPLVSRAELQALEKFADRILDKFKVDIEFTKHFGERVADSRNKPMISVEELAAALSKIIKDKAKRVKKHKDAEAVIKDIQSDLNMPVVVDFNPKSQEFEIRFKTIMRKKKFFTRDPIIRYEEKEH